MKKSFYIFCFIVLGVILQQIVHTIVEIWYIKLLVGNFDRYGLGLSWGNWFTIHHIFAALFVASGVMWGYWQGKKCWSMLYDENGKIRHPRSWHVLLYKKIFRVWL